MMKYLNLTLNDLGSEEFLGSTPTQRATWICLLRYCAQQETGGVIEQATDWGNRKWMQICGVTKDEVLECCPLWRWENSNLIVWAYPLKQEKAAQSRRESGKIHGIGQPNKSPNRSPKRSPNRSPDRTAIDKGKGKGKDKGKDNITPKPSKEGKKDNSNNNSVSTWKYNAFSKRLKEACEKVITIPKNANLGSWSKAFRKLHKIDGVTLDEIDQTLKAYERIIGKPFIPEAYSGKSFRAKYTNIKAAIRRQEKPQQQQKFADPDLAKSQSLSGM